MVDVQADVMLVFLEIIVQVPVRLAVKRVIMEYFVLLVKMVLFTVTIT